MAVMSSREGNRETMAKFLRDTDAECEPALLDCVPDNSDALTGHGLMQAGRAVCVVF